MVASSEALWTNEHERKRNDLNDVLLCKPESEFEFELEPESGDAPEAVSDERWATSDDGKVRISSHGRVKTKLPNGKFGHSRVPQEYATRAPRVLGKRFAEMVFEHFCSPSESDTRSLLSKKLRVETRDGNWDNIAASNLKLVVPKVKRNATSFKAGVRRAHHGKAKQRVVSYRDGQHRVHVSQCHCARDMTEILTELKAEGKFSGNPVCNQGGVRKCIKGEMESYKGFRIASE